MLEQPHALGADRGPGRGHARRADGRRRGRPHRSPSPSTATRPSAPPPAWPRHGVGAGDVVSWQLPTWFESMVLVGALCPAGRGAEPDPADLPRARGRLHRAAGRRQAARSSRELRRLRLRRPWPQGIAGRRRRPRGARRRQARCPRAIRRRCRRPPRPDDDDRSAGSSTRRAPRPTPRARSTPTARPRRRRRHVRAARHHRRRPHRAWCSRSPTSAGSSGCSPSLQTGCTLIFVSTFVPSTASTS